MAGFYTNLTGGPIPRHHDIGQQTQCIGNSLHFVRTLGLRRTDPAGVNVALEGVDRLAPLAKTAHFADTPGATSLDEVLVKTHEFQYMD